ncbi:hypothetical protein Pta6605_32400 [Pseudomonas amygdali pv. tabaci]|nr:hypothetical protein Pta6605_32400 [Pseudomonas amygdali pv. tabaci]
MATVLDMEQARREGGSDVTGWQHCICKACGQKSNGFGWWRGCLRRAMPAVQRANAWHWHQAQLQ